MTDMFHPILQKALRDLGFTFYGDGRVVHKRTEVIVTPCRDERESCWLTIKWRDHNSLLLTIPIDKLHAAVGIKAAADLRALD